MKTLLLAPVLLAGLLCSSAIPMPAPAPVPYIAYCRTLWLFATPCADVSMKLVAQIQAFNPLNACEECQYMLVSAMAGTIKANHTSLDGVMSENITISLKPTMMSGGCRVSAKSVSLQYGSLLDNGLNYCNLYNLLSASGLTSSPGFMEVTNDWACLGYGLATCKA